MGTIVNTVILANAGEILQDVNSVRWTAAKKLKWLNAAIRQLCLLKPEAYTVYLNLKLGAGTKQPLPTGALVLVDLHRNMGTAGNVPGRVPRFVEKKVLDAENPMWHKDLPGAEVLHWSYDERDQKVFWVYPPQPATGQGYVDISHTALPGDISGSAPIPVDDVYAEALTDYVVARCYAQDPANLDKATVYMQSFMTAVLGKGKFDAEVKAALDKEA